MNIVDNKPRRPAAFTKRPELIERMIKGELTIAQSAGLSKQTLYSIAQVGYQFLNLGRLDEARKIYRGLVAADPFDSVFHCHLAAVLHRSGEINAALEEYTAALRFNIANVDALVGRGLIHLAQGRVVESIHDLKRAVELDPQAKKPSSLRARATLMALKDAADAVQQQQQLQTAQQPLPPPQVQQSAPVRRTA